MSNANFTRFISDFQFLFRIIRDSHGELDLRLRNNYFNLYYKGNSMLKVGFRRSGYTVTIHEKFTPGVFDTVDARLQRILKSARGNGSYMDYIVPSRHLRPFLQKKHIGKIGTRIKKVNYGEEITFEHALITDNLGREDYFIIDRQVRQPGSLHQMDLLGLRQINGDSYALEVIEVKMGSNPELAGKVGDQLATYLRQVRSNISQWVRGYEVTYQQLQSTNIFSGPSYSRITITPCVTGRIVVMGYSGIAKELIAQLTRKHPSIRVQQMSHVLDNP